jgi:hypothetical protein
MDTLEDRAFRLVAVFTTISCSSHFYLVLCVDCINEKAALTSVVVVGAEKLGVALLLAASEPVTATKPI